MSLNLTPVTPGSLTLDPISGGGKSYLLQEDGAGLFTLEDGSGFILLEDSASGLSLTPITPGTLTLTPDPTT